MSTEILARTKGVWECEFFGFYLRKSESCNVVNDQNVGGYFGKV